MQYTVKLSQDKNIFINTPYDDYLYAGTDIENAIAARDALNAKSKSITSVYSSNTGLYYKTEHSYNPINLISWPYGTGVPMWPDTPITPIFPTPSTSPIVIPPTPEPQNITGWICPVCGAGVNPYVQKCPCTNSHSVTITYTNDTAANNSIISK